jgi:hypothetical protein
MREVGEATNNEPLIVLIMVVLAAFLYMNSDTEWFENVFGKTVWKKHFERE